MVTITTCAIKEKTPINLPCANCSSLSFGSEANFMLACCRAVYCPICIGYYLEEAEHDGHCSKCHETAIAMLVFEFESDVDAFQKRRQEDEEERMLRELALNTLSLAATKKVSEPEKMPVILGRKKPSESEPKKKAITWDLDSRKESSSTSELENRRSLKRRSHSNGVEPKPKRRQQEKYDRTTYEPSFNNRDAPSRSSSSHNQQRRSHRNPVVARRRVITK